MDKHDEMAYLKMADEIMMKAAEAALEKLPRPMRTETGKAMLIFAMMEIPMNMNGKVFTEKSRREKMRKRWAEEEKSRERLLNGDWV